MIDLVPACRVVTDLVAGLRDNQFDEPTPCPGMTIGDVVDHLDEVAVGFTSVAGRESPDAEAGFADHVRALGDAWADPTAWEGRTDAGDGLELANVVWGRIVLTELVVHGWDLARATGRELVLPDATLEACLAHVVDFVPSAPVPELWGDAVEVPDDAPLIDRIVAVTGRDPVSARPRPR